MPRMKPDDDIWPTSKRLVDTYIASEHRDAFFTNMRTEHRLLFELRADVVRAIDMRVYRGKRADRDLQRRWTPDAAAIDLADVALDGWSETP